MNAEKKAIEMEHLVKLSKVLKGSSEQERQQILIGGSILFDLDWPYSVILGRKMCVRAIQGLVPIYEGPSSRIEYNERWWSEDHEWQHISDSEP